LTCAAPVGSPRISIAAAAPSAAICPIPLPPDTAEVIGTKNRINTGNATTEAINNNTPDRSASRPPCPGSRKAAE
jgi:hypothetical protein